MIFSKHSIKLIRARRKTQTTRLKEPRVKIGGIYPIKRNLFKKEHLGRVKVLSKEKTTLSRFIQIDLRKEGYYGSVEKFREALERINKKKISLREPVWKIVFRYIPN